MDKCPKCDYPLRPSPQIILDTLTFKRKKNRYEIDKVTCKKCGNVIKRKVYY